MLDWFRANMPIAESELHYNNPFELIVAVVLSAQCTDKRVNQVTPALFKAYPTAQLLAQASLDDVLFYIQSVSYPNNKAKHLIGLAQKLQQDFNGEVPANLEQLQTLPGSLLCLSIPMFLGWRIAWDWLLKPPQPRWQ